MKTNTVPVFSKEDTRWMRLALQEAARGAGYVSPNPMVGCVIVSAENRLLSKGHHQRYGEDHAEINALKGIKDERNLIDATVYVTLEPCSHYGKTPPCSLALSELPVKRVVVAMIDPNPKVSGKGVEILRANSIQVDVGLLKVEAMKLNEAFCYFISNRKPFVTLKIAQTADGYTAAPDGSSKWISGEEARKMVHQLRSEYDSVMVGRNTVLLDNPSLTVREVDGRHPWRVVIDGDLSLPEDLVVFSDKQEEKTIRFTYNSKKFEANDPILNLLTPGYFRGKTYLVGKRDGHTDLDNVLDKLAANNITSVLVESGGALATELIKQRLVNKLYLFIAPKLLGGGKKSVIGLGIDRINDILNLKSHSWQQIGNDMLLTGYF